MFVVFRSMCVVNWRFVGVIKFLNEKKNENIWKVFGKSRKKNDIKKNYIGL